MDLSSVTDDTRCALMLGTGDMTIGELKQDLLDTDDRAEVITTGQAHERWPAYSQAWWSQAAREQRIEAWQDAEDGPWRLVRESCEELMDKLRRRGLKHELPGRRGPRGPWKKRTQRAQTA